jgi:hypothetical protein
MPPIPALMLVFTFSPLFMVFALVLSLVLFCFFMIVPFRRKMIEETDADLTGIRVMCQRFMQGAMLCHFHSLYPNPGFDAGLNLQFLGFRHGLVKGGLLLLHDGLFPPASVASVPTSP